MKKNIFLFICIFFTILIVYKPLFNTFFQQDEWLTFGVVIMSKQLSFLSQLSSFIFIKYNFHFAPLTAFFNSVFFNLFGLNFTAYALNSVFFHILNSLLVFYLSSLLLERKNLAIVVALLFALDSNTHQAVTWIAASIGTQGACFFSLLSLFLLAKYISNGKKDRKLFWSYLMIFLIGLLFKETAAFLFIFLPIFWLIFVRKRDLLSLKKLLIPLFIFGLFYFSLRIFLLLNTPSFSAEQAKALTPPPKVVYLYRLVSLPLRAIPQSLISTRQIISWAEKLVYFVYPHYFVAADGAANPFVVETIAFDFICFLLFIVISFFSYFLYRYLEKSGERQMVKGFLFALALIVAGALPLIFIPGKAGYSSIIEPRHLYITGIGSSLFLTILIFSLGNWLKKKTGFSTYFWVLFLLIPILLIHIKNIRNDINKLVIDGQIRKSILTRIKNEYPILPEKVVFYTESDTAYYGLADEEKILPFQSGFGQTLLVWYHAHGEKFPPCMFADLWLYPIETQGYQYCQGRGFGFFRKYEDLVRAIKENKLGPENVIAFSWESKKKVLQDTTFQVREKIKSSPSVLEH